MAKKFSPSVGPPARLVHVGVAPTVVMTSSRTGPVRPPRSMMFVVGTLPVSAAHRLSAPGAYGAPTSTASVAISCLPVLFPPAHVMRLAPATRIHGLVTAIDRARFPVDEPLRPYPALPFRRAPLVLRVLPEFRLALPPLRAPVPVILAALRQFCRAVLASPFTGLFRVALAAVTQPRYRADGDVLAFHHMTLGTRVLPPLQPVSAIVLKPGDRLKMRRVDAGAHIAQVIKMEQRRNLAHKQDVGHPVRSVVTSLQVRDPVAVFPDVSRPDPAP